MLNLIKNVLFYPMLVDSKAAHLVLEQSLLDSIKFKKLMNHDHFSEQQLYDEQLNHHKRKWQVWLGFNS